MDRNVVGRQRNFTKEIEQTANLKVIFAVSAGVIFFILYFDFTQSRISFESLFAVPVRSLFSCFSSPTFRAPGFAISFLRLHELKRKNRDCS